MFQAASPLFKLINESAGFMLRKKNVRMQQGQQQWRIGKSPFVIACIQKI